MQYLWENPEGIEQSVLEVYPLKTTTYRVKGFSVVAGTQDTCSAFGEKTIQVYPFNPPQLGKDRDGCRGDTIVLNGGNNFESWSWSNNETGQIVRITESVPQLILFAKDRNQCILTDTIAVKIKELPVINLGNDTIQCSGKPLELYGGEGDSYAWSATDSPQRRDTTARIYVNFSDTYKLTITKNGCTNTDSIAVTIKDLPKISLNYPRDTTICLADSIKLTGGKGDSYLWSNGKTTQSIYVNRADQYWLRISLDGCDNSDTVDLKVNPVPIVDLGRDTAFCKSNPVRLTGGSGDSYLWEPGGAVTPDILVNETGTYSLTITKNGCPNSDTVKIRINDPGLLKIKSVDHTPVSCPGYRDGSLRINAEGSGVSYEYSIDGGENFYTDSVFKGLYGDHEFHIMVREDKACTVTWDEAIVFKEPEPIQIGYHLVSPSCELCPDGEINLQVKGGTPPYSVKWSTNDTVSFLSNVTLGKYLVWVTDVNRCPANAMIDLTLDYPPFQIPNAFTPNGDGINEKWEIASLKDFPDCLVKIFDRSGKLIWWSEAGYPEPWDGIDKSGNVLPVGSYYYLVWLRSDLKPLKGSVSILR
jgi:gliding motility-associated-like protein